MIAVTQDSVTLFFFRCRLGPRDGTALLWPCTSSAVPCRSAPGLSRLSEPCWLALTCDSGTYRQLAPQQQGILSVLPDGHSLCPERATALAQLTCATAVLRGLLSCRRKCSKGFSFIFLFVSSYKQTLNILSVDRMAQGLRMIKSRRHTETSRNYCF